MAPKKKEIGESRIEKGLKSMLRYNDYALVVVNIEIFFLTYLSKDSDPDKDKNILKDLANFLQIFFLNALFVKQIAQQLYYDVCISHALKSQKLFTIDLR